MTDADAIFERACQIAKERLAEASGDPRAAILSLVSSDAVVDLLIMDLGTDMLALQSAAYHAASRELEAKAVTPPL